MQNNISDEQFEQIVEKGRQLHNQAVSDFFIQIVLSPMRIAKEYIAGHHNERQSMKHSPEIHA